MLTCGCEDFCPEPGDTYIHSISDYKPAQFTGYRKRCKNCRTQIDKLALCVEVHRVKVPDTDVECAIYGEEGEIPRASWWLCESCADIFFSLEELGYCVPIGEIKATLKEYQQYKAAGYL